MLFGVKRDIPDDFYSALVTTGTLHVIALSGMNISIIVRLLFESTSSFFNKRLAGSITFSGIIAFVLLVGFSASIVRASIMGCIGVLAVIIGRKDIPLISLFLTTLIMILLDPLVISSISFQLSIFATLGILLFAGNKLPVHKKKTNTIVNNLLVMKFISFLKDDLRVTLSAQVFTLPLILFYFQRVSLISPLTNVAVGWLVAPITYLGFLTVFFSLVWLPLGRMAAVITWVPLNLFIWFVELTSSIPYASLELSD